MNVQPIRKHSYSSNNVAFGMKILPNAQKLIDGHFLEIAKNGTYDELVRARNYEAIIKKAGAKSGAELNANAIFTGFIKDDASRIKVHKEDFIINYPDGKNVPIVEVNNEIHRLSPIRILQTLAEKIQEITRV